MHKLRLPALHIVTILLLVLMTTAVGHASPSNKWRLSFSGKANADGVIVFKISSEAGEPITTEVPVQNNTGENGVAKTVVKSLQEQLPKDGYRVERDDGEDVLIKKRGKTPNFDLEIVSNTVEGVRINPEHE